MTKLFRFLSVFCLSFILFSSCSSFKKVPYIQDLSALDSSQTNELFEAQIMPKDLLTITVYTSEPELAIPFNLTVQTVVGTRSNSLTSQPALQQYLVDNDGNIEFPVLGRLHVGGMYKKEVERMIQDKLKTYIKEEPIVTVRLVNYKISVTGEVARPGMFTVSNEKINVLEALAMAGDMTIYGERTNVKIIREKEDGKQEVWVVDVTDANIINSPYYYLQQNDIVYVTPNKVKRRNADIGTVTTLTISIFSVLISTTSLVVNLIRK